MAEPFLLVALRFIQGEPGMHFWDGSRKPRSTTCQQPLILLLVAALPAGQEASGQEFVRRTQEAGLAAVARTNGVALADYDRDGDLDVYFVVQDSYKASDPRTWNRLFANRGDGTFSDVTTIAGLAGRNATTTANPNGMGNKMGAAWGDYDNDSWPDLLLTHYGPNQLFHNNGDGTFTEVTSQAGIATRRNQLTGSALWFDYDRDGDLDLYLSIYAEFFAQPNDRSNRLYENLGEGRFRDVSTASGTADAGATWTTVALDANNDGHLDLYLANDFGPNKFYLNNGDKTFQERTADFGLEDEFHGMGLTIADCDGNGYFDLYLTNITQSAGLPETNPLFLNTGQNRFINGAQAAGVALAGWGWGTEFFDLENDGDEDLAVVTGNFQPDFANVIFRNLAEQGTLLFENIAPALGMDDSTVARAVAIFDYDNDGDSDLLISNFFESPYLYQNTRPHGNWLAIKLTGTISNRDGFGAVVEVVANGVAHRKLHHGAHFLSQSIRPLHFGLGSAPQAERITVTWPSGHRDEIGAVPANQSIRIREQSGLVSSVSRPAESPATMPGALRLLGNHPNPFRGTTNFRFVLAGPGEVELKIFNVQGQVVQEIRASYPSGGEKSLAWNGRQTAVASSGIYFYILTLRSTGVSVVGKTFLVK